MEVAELHVVDAHRVEDGRVKVAHMGALVDGMQAQLIRLNQKVATLPPPADGAWPLVVMYGHSMCGAALAILTGNGKQVDGENYLGFDGKYIMPNATPVYLHKSTSTDSR